MRHSFLDQYSDRDSLIHRLDPRTKLVSTFLFITAVALTPPDGWVSYALYSAILAIWLMLSRVPLGYVLKRSLVVLPFVVLIAIFIPFFREGEIAGSYNLWLWQVSVTHSGIIILRNILIRAWLSVLSLILLTSTTKLPDLLRGLEQLHMPRVMVMVLSFMYRYIFVLVDEVMRMKQARDSRNFGGRRWWQIRTVGNMIGTLFIRAYERGERVYAAMMARGFDGQSRTLKRLEFKPADAYFGLSLGTLVIWGNLINLI
ncbi:MAG TPA: cobalt ECF transporter T component CbiQ [Dehalococcoidia bacterium]|jgi:cobalt/nickel transport system permease protein|nr:cobalt ECF transporter T component CbiQ [Dehalococcoidia bacterium]